MSSNDPSIPPAKTLLVNPDTMGSLALDKEAAYMLVLGLMALSRQHQLGHPDQGRAQAASDLADSIHNLLFKGPVSNLDKMLLNLEYRE